MMLLTSLRWLVSMHVQYTGHSLDVYASALTARGFFTATGSRM